MKFFKSLYLNPRLYIAIIAIIVIFIFGHFFQIFFILGKTLLLAILAFLIVDSLMLYNQNKNVITARRNTPERLSNGDENDVSIYLKSNYNFNVKIKIIDEIPHQFQIRDFCIIEEIKSGQEKTFQYKLRPVKRGEYNYGLLNVYVSGVIGLISRRFKFEQEKILPTYPSYLQMRKYELLAISNRLTEAGIKKIRKISNNNEFEQIREYVKGDDFRTMNWKATARKTQLMVNQYQDEKSQQVYSLIDMGRVMKMPFDGMSLLDYAINTSLVISNIAIYKQDKAGILTFTDKINSIVPASRRNVQMQTILEVLYKQKTNFMESNYELLYATVKRKIRHRSLLLLYTNFEGLISLKRQLSFLKRLAKSHLLVVIFFENTEIKKITQTPDTNITKQTTEDIYKKTVAEKFVYEKKQIVKELINNGIYAILTEPQNLTVNTINKYLELKARGLI